MDTDATDDQRALLEVSTRFMEDACPLRAGARRRVAATTRFAASYRRQAAELGWFSMLVPEALGGGSVSGNGVLDAALIAYARGGLLQPGSFVGTNVVAYAVARAGSDDAARRGAPGAAGGRGRRRRGRSPAPATAAGSTAASTAAPTDDGGLELTGAKTAVQDVERVVVAARHVRDAGRPGPGARAPPTRPGVTVDRARVARPHPALRRGPLRRRPGRRRRRSSARPATVDELLDRQLAVAVHAHRRRDRSARWTTTSR